MGLINSILKKALAKRMDKYIEENQTRLLTAMQKVNEGGNAEDIDTIVYDYFYLLKSVYHKGKPHCVTIDKNDFFVLTVDGDEYDFDSLVRHNDRKNTERKMEIEVLLSDSIPFDEIEKRLNQRIEEKW